MIDLPLGLLLGLFAGVAYVVLREVTDDRIHTPMDVQQVTRQAPVLGTIPRFDGPSAAAPRPGGSKPSAAKLSERVLAATNPRSPVAEAYRSLRTNLTYANLDDPIRTLVVTSPLPQDGKSTTAANLAVTLSQQGIRTLLVDADLRRGVLASVFDQPRVPGLTTVLQGSAKLDEAIRTVRVGQAPPLDFLSSGQFPPNPAEVLGSKRMRTLLANLRERYDIVVIDTAPLAVVTDAAVLATDVDGIILVVRADVTDKGAVRYADEQLEKVGVSLRGTVINAVDFKRDSRYYSSYGDYRVKYASYFADDAFIVENGQADAEDVRPGSRTRADAPVGSD